MYVYGMVWSIPISSNNSTTTFNMDFMSINFIIYPQNLLCETVTSTIDYVESTIKNYDIDKWRGKYI